MLDRYDERREDRREDKREERRHRHSQRNYGEDEVDGTDTRHSSHRSHRRYDKDAEKSDHRRHRHHHHSRSQSPDRDRDRERHRDRDRTSEKEKFHYREDDRDEERRRRRRESRSLGNSAAPTPTTPFAPEFTNGYEEHSSRKRRNRDYDEDREQERYEKKRSRRESSPAYDNKSDRHEHNYENSKPPTPITPNFGGHSPVSRRGSIATNGVSQVKAPILSKPIPTGPRASLQQNRKAERFEEPEQQAPAAPAKKPEKDVHTLEREARDRERLQREMQRRAFGSSKRRTSGTATQPSRRVSYKYEDEDGLDARRVEHEREAGRWS
ncbi:hypothetical protein MMC10_002630 [Thelotrema lepadinum]|nr:hypothetical protein [Thelotrema lepadinum]